MTESASKSVLIVSGVFAALACIISFGLLFQHFRYYTRPKQQRCIVRILFMVPVYAIYSFLSLVFVDLQRYFAVFRDCYEAYALYMFFVLLIEYEGGEERLLQNLKQHPPVKLLFPLWCTVRPGRYFLVLCRRGILQYALVRPIVSLVSTVLLILDKYKEGEWDADSGYLYATIINNIGVTISLYCLAMFYQVVKEDIASYKPILKFATVKMIVFFCYWQSVIIAIVVAFHGVKTLDEWSPGQVATAIQNCLICVEMLFFSILHIWAFPTDIYKIIAWSQAPFIHQIELGGSVMKGVRNAANQSDMVSDTAEAFNLKRKKDKYIRPASDTSGMLKNEAEEPVSETSNGEHSVDDTYPHELEYEEKLAEDAIHISKLRR